MKTIKKEGEILRVTDVAADEMVKNEDWSFCPKSEWKAIRNVKKTKKSKK